MYLGPDADQNGVHPFHLLPVYLIDPGLSIQEIVGLPRSVHSAVGYGSADVWSEDT